jgi:hypothetical protein
VSPFSRSVRRGSRRATARRIAADYVARVGRGRFEEVFSKEEWKDMRNRREGLAWCRVLDSLLSTRAVSLSHDGVEMMVRRLSGLYVADQSGGNWKLCEILERGRSPFFLPDDVLRAAFADVATWEAVSRSGNTSRGNRGASARSDTSSSSSGATGYSGGGGKSPRGGSNGGNSGGRYSGSSAGSSSSSQADKSSGANASGTRKQQ